MMLDVPTLKVRRVGNSLGVILPKGLVDEYQLRPGDDVQIGIERAVAMEDTFGMLAKYRMTLDEWNDLTNEGEDL